jgi:hypothetical protein
MISAIVIRGVPHRLFTGANGPLLVIDPRVMIRTIELP